MSKLKTYLRFSFVLLLLSGLAYLFYLKPFGSEFWSAHTLYKRQLWFSGYSEVDIDSWKQASLTALADSLFLSLPAQININNSSKEALAWVYHLQLQEGEKLDIDLPSDKELFIDLFYLKNATRHIHQKSINEDIEIPIFETGEYYLRLQTPIHQVIQAQITLTKKPYYATFPVAGKGNKAIQSFWGAPRDGGRRKHEGIDIFAAKGTPLLAVCDGEIDRVANGGLGGKTVWLYDREADQSIYYAHLDEQHVEVGDFVKEGEQIGTVGNTGNARTTPPHLHLGIYLRKAIDPLPFFKTYKEVPSAPKYSDLLKSTQAIVRSKTARLFHAPNVKQKADIVLVKNTKVEVIAAIGIFLHIKTDLGRSYFIQGNDLKRILN